MITTAIDLAALDGARIVLTAEQLHDLLSRVGAPLLHAGDEGWNDALTVWNGSVAEVPPRRRLRANSPTKEVEMFGRSIPRALALLCAGAILTSFAAACSDDDSILFPGLSGDVNAQLAELRSATESFQAVQDANTAGYDVLVAHPMSGDRCFTHAQLGAMGFHYLNGALVDDAVSVTEPEVLIYEPRSDGSLELVGVEYVIPFALHGDREPAPVLFGQEFRQNYTFGLWTLHAYAWKQNPSGPFADWNPNVSCQHETAVP